jgi:hypothetical protein
MTTLHRFLSSPSLLRALGLLAPGLTAACGSPVGSTCMSDRDCPGFCLLGNSDYPGGYCTVRCSSDAQCPGGTNCIDESGGICVASCRDSSECGRFGRGFVCEDRDRLGALGKAFVCRVP